MRNKLFKRLLEYLCRNNFVLTTSGLDGLLLTFDDGPHPKHTPIIIDALAQRNIKAIFFVIGKDLENYPELGELIIQNGHTLGNHTYEHLDLEKCDFKDYRYSIEKTNEIISSFQPASIKIFRPPYGRLSPQLIAYTVLSRSLLMNWSLDSRDSFIKDNSSLVAYVKSLQIIKGDILLFHEDYHHTATTISDILDHIVSLHGVFFSQYHLEYKSRKRSKARRVVS